VWKILKDAFVDKAVSDAGHIPARRARRVVELDKAADAHSPNGATPVGWRH